MRRTALFVLFILLPQLAFAGSQTYSTPGTYTFTVPAFSSLSVTVSGAGGGGGGSEATYPNNPGSATDGSGGGNSSFYNLTAYGGSGGQRATIANDFENPPYSYGTGANGGNGSASGGSYNAAGSGAAGGAGGPSWQCQYYGYAPYCTNQDYYYYYPNGGWGGSGGYSSITWSQGSGPTPGSNVTVYVGGGGAGGASSYGTYNGGGSSAGGDGSVSITWTAAPAPTCTITLAPNPASYSYNGTVTLTYSSTNANTSFYINNVGYVGASGSTQVPRTATTNYTGTVVGSGGSATCPATLTVTPPSNPTATITSSLGSTVQIGQSTTITAHFTAGSGDSLTHDNIDSPVGTGLGATTNPDPIKLYTFTPTTPGTYTFYARAQTSYFTSWTTYASVTVTVPTPPACTVAFNQNPIAQGQSATVSWTSSNATSFSINTIGSVTPNTPGSTSVSPAQSTDYTGTAIGTGGTTNCHANTGTPPGTLNVSCTPSYTCSGNNIRYTNASCSVATTATCTAPAFCSTGSSICLYPPPSFNQSDGLTGHLEVHPSIVPQGQTTTVSWNVSNVSSCSVAGTNGDSFSGLSGNHTSGNILQQTTYTLTCAGLDGSTVNESQVVNVLPAFEEN
jgi:hypothetical protein